MLEPNSTGHAMDSPQHLQDAEYRFPYHYVSQWRPHFTQAFCDTWGINYVSTIEHLLERLGRHEFRSIVDIGCGDGRLTREIAAAFPGREVLGVDYSARAIGLAQAMNADVAASFMRLDITAPHDVGRHDIAMLVEVLEHVPPDAAPAFLRGVHRLLRPGGTLIVTVPHSNRPVYETHYRHFDGAALADALGEQFTVAEMMPFERQSLSRRVLDGLLANRLFVLNHRRTLDRLYAYYRRRLFRCADESECRRLLAVVHPR